MSPATERRRRLQVLEFQSNLPAVPDYGPRVQISNHGFHQNPMNATLPPLMPDYCRIPNSVLSPQRERMNALARTYRQPESLPPSNHLHAAAANAGGCCVGGHRQQHCSRHRRCNLHL